MKRGVVIGVTLCIAAVVAFFLLHRDSTVTALSSGSAAGSQTTSSAPRQLAAQKTGRRIAGLVVGDDNQPIAGAHVQLASRATSAGARAPMLVTAADGAFDFGLQAPIAYVVFADATALTGAAYELDLRQPQTPSEKLRIVLHPCDTAIHGVVRDTVGGTIAGALVSRSSARTHSTTGAVSDANGSYELCIPAGGANVMVVADSYATLQTRVDVSGRTLRDFVLAPGTTVKGNVVLAADKKPVEGATVVLTEKDEDITLYATSTEDGSFEIEGVLPGRREVSAFVDNLKTLDPPEVAVEIGAPNEVTCELTAVASVTGRLVLASDDHVGVANMNVALSPTTSVGDGSQGTTSRSDGTFAFERVSPGDYAIVIRGGDRKNRPAVHVEGADVSGIVIKTEAPSSVSGRVLYENKPVEGAMVQARAANTQSSATTDSEGRFAFEALLGDTIQLYAESTRAGAFTQGPSIALARGEHKTGVDITLDLAGSIAGVVVDQNNQPLAGVFIRFSLLHGSDFGQATTADDGSFAARAMSGGGEYVYEVTDRADSPISFPPADGKRFAPITVATGTTHVTGLRVKVKRERLTIAGRVVDETGAGVPDATVRARPSTKGGSYLPPITATTDQTGAYVLRDLGHGTASLSATASRGESEEISVEAGVTNAVLTLQQLGNIDVTLDGFVGSVSVIARSDNRSSRYSGTHSGTTIHYRNVFPGPYTLEVYAHDDAWEDHSVAVTGGETATVTLKPRATGRVDGVLVDATTKLPVEDAHCTSVSGSWKPDATDRSGAFHLTVVAGESAISCWKTGYDVANKETMVVADQVVNVSLSLSPTAIDNVTKIASGITFENQLNEVMVAAVEPNTPGARAGVQVGDVVTKADGETSIDAWYLQTYGHRPVGEKMTLEVERGEKTLTLTVVFE